MASISREQILDMLEPGLLALFGDGCPTSKEEAKANKKNFYYDDRLCRNGHLAIKKLNGHCTRCIKNKLKKGKTHE